MTQFSVHTIESAPEGSKARLAEVAKAWGFVPKLHGVLAESPATLEGYDLLFGLVAQSSFQPAEQQAIYLAISVFHGCEYCTAGHTFLARKAGLPEDAIEGLREGRPLADRRLQVLRTFTEAVVRERGAVDHAVIDGFVAAGFTRAQVLEVVLVVATKTISNYTNHMAATPKESFMADKALAWTAPANRERAA